MQANCCRCGVRLYREQKKAHNAEDHLDDDDKDDSSSCTYTISGTPFADAQPAAVRDSALSFSLGFS